MGLDITSMPGESEQNMTGSAPTRNQRLTESVLWGLVIAYAIGSRIIPGLITPLLFPFALIHGGRRYGWKTIAIFMVVTAIVSNILENSSILIGFPFGNYYYTDSLGPKIALVPFFISLSYISFGYLAWAFTVYIFFQLFALYQRKRGSEDLSRALPATHYLQAIILYLWTGVGFVLGYLFMSPSTYVIDAAGHVWTTGDIFESMAISAIYTMIFISILALAILYRDKLAQKRA